MKVKRFPEKTWTALTMYSIHILLTSHGLDPFNIYKELLLIKIYIPVDMCMHEHVHTCICILCLYICECICEFVYMFIYMCVWPRSQTVSLLWCQLCQVCERCVTIWTQVVSVSAKIWNCIQNHHNDYNYNYN